MADKIMQPPKATRVEKMNGTDILYLALILSIAVFLRFYGLPHIEFKADEAMNLLIGIDLVEGIKFPLVGISSSIGTKNSATFIYLISLPLIFTRNPVYVSGFIALISVAAVYGCFLLGRSMFNKRVGFIASALLAVNPWMLLYSRKIWQQDILPFLTLGFFYSLYKGAIKRQHGYLLISACFLSVITQVHLSTIGFIVLFFYFLWIYKNEIHSKFVFGCAAIFGLLYVPYGIFEIQNNFFNTKILLSRGLQRVTFFPDALTIPFTLSTALNFLEGTTLPVIDYAVCILMAAALLFMFTKWKDVRYKLLACWFLIPMIFLASGRIDMKGDTPYFYFIQYYPLLFLAAAIGIDALLTLTDKQPRKKFGLLIYSFLFAVLIYQASVSFRFDYRLGKEQNIFWMGYGPPFSMRVKEIKEIVDNERYKGNTTIDARQVQSILEHTGKTYKYDDQATYYIFKYIHEQKI